MASFQGQGQGKAKISNKQREEIFWSKVLIKNLDECWIYKGYKTQAGYGQFYNGISIEYAHRFAYESYHKCKIPIGKFILHRCDNPACCNPRHLYIGTQYDNVGDMILRKRTRKSQNTNIL